MAFAWGKGSRRNMVGIHPDLLRHAERLIQITPVDLTIISGGGFRSLAQARANVANGTGILNSLHRKQSDGYGHAIDYVAYIHGRPSWSDSGAYKEIALASEEAAAELSIPLRGGYDWDMDGVWGESREWDWPHREIPKAWHLPRAIELMNRNRTKFGFDVVDAPCPTCGRAA